MGQHRVTLELHAKSSFHASKLQGQAGLTLVELLVAVVISLVIALAAVSALTVSRRGLNTVDAAAQLGDNARFARALLLRLGAQAGFRDIEYAATPRTNNTVGLSGSGTVAPNVSGVNNALPSYTDPYNSYTTRSTGSVGYGSDILILRHQVAETFPESGVSDKTMIDCSGNQQHRNVARHVNAGLHPGNRQTHRQRPSCRFDTNDQHWHKGLHGARQQHRRASHVVVKIVLAMIRSRSQEKGFTLIELMVTLTIAAVLALVAAPGLTAYKRNAELTSTINTLLSAINAARSEAMKRGMKAMVLPADRSRWSSGWIVFVDKDGDQAYSEANDITILTQSPPESYFSISGSGSASGSAPYILYDGSGYSRLKNGGFGALTLSLSRNDLSGRSLYEQTRRVVIAKTGRVRTCKPASATDTACAANSTQ